MKAITTAILLASLSSSPLLAAPVTTVSEGKTSDAVLFSNNPTSDLLPKGADISVIMSFDIGGQAAVSSVDLSNPSHYFFFNANLELDITIRGDEDFAWRITTDSFDIEIWDDQDLSIVTLPDFAPQSAVDLFYINAGGLQLEEQSGSGTSVAILKEFWFLLAFESNEYLLTETISPVQYPNLRNAIYSTYTFEFFEPGQIFDEFDLGVENSSAAYVPLPGSIWLLASSVFGMGIAKIRVKTIASVGSDSDS